MKDEIKEILDDLLFTTTLPNVSIKLNKEKLNQLKDYITNLQDTLKDREEYCYGLETQLTNLQEENERLNKDLQTAIDICNNRQKEIVKLNNIINAIRKYLKDNEREYGSLEDNEKIILNIIKGE